MNLNIFNTNNLFEAATNLFQQLNIKLIDLLSLCLLKTCSNSITKPNDTFKAIDKTFFIGSIDHDTVFKATGMFLMQTIPTKKQLSKAIKTTMA